jgi:hypothetical protein
MSDQQPQRGNALRTATRSRSRSRERDALLLPTPRRQLRSTTRAAAAIDAAYGNHPRSISRLHDDELSIVLSFLLLKDLALIVRCSHRFNGVARRERSRGVDCDPSVNDIPALTRSPLNHHIASMGLGWRDASKHVTRAMLHSLRALPQLTKLNLWTSSNKAAAALLQGTSSRTAAKRMQAALPTSLRSFFILTDVETGTLSADFVPLGAAYLAAATNMSLLTELSIHHEASWDDMRLDTLVALPLLRKLSLRSLCQVIPLSGLKQLSQLRELELEQVDSYDLLALCQPPHLLLLESLTVDIEFGEEDMRTLAHLPTLTELAAQTVLPGAWPLLADLPRLRRLSMADHFLLIGTQATDLSEALARCAALDDLTLSLHFKGDNFSDLSEEEQRARWTLLLRGLPNLRQLCMVTTSVATLIAVLPAHLPRLVRLVLFSMDACEVVLAQLAHPTLQEFKLTDLRPLTEEEVESLLHNPRLPRLISCKSSPY